MLSGRIKKLEIEIRRRRAPRKLLVVYENDSGEHPKPTPEELADPSNEVITVRYVDDWRTPVNK